MGPAAASPTGWGVIQVDLLIEALIVVCAIPANLYPAFYAFRPWWTTPQGKALMVKAVGNAILIDMGLSVVIFGDDYPMRWLVRVVGFALFGAGVWLLFLALLRSDCDGRYPPARWWRRLTRCGYRAPHGH